MDQLKFAPGVLIAGPEAFQSVRYLGAKDTARSGNELLRPP